MSLKSRRWLCAAVVLLLVVVGGLALSWESDRSVESLKGRWASPASGSKFVDVRGMQVHVRDYGPRTEARLNFLSATRYGSLNSNVEVVKKLRLEISYAWPEKSTHQNDVSATISCEGMG